MCKLYTYMTYTDTAVNTKSSCQFFIKLCKTWTVLLVTELCYTKDSTYKIRINNSVILNTNKHKM